MSNTYKNGKLFNLLNKNVNLNSDGADLLHGIAKYMLVELIERLSSTEDCCKKANLEGQIYAWEELYQFTYDLAFAKNDLAIERYNQS